MQSVLRQKLPAQYCQLQLFRLIKVPPCKSLWRDKQEPRWADVVACSNTGQPLPLAEPVSVALSWLEPGFRIPKGLSSEEQQSKLATLLMKQLTASNGNAPPSALVHSTPTPTWNFF